MASDYKTAAGKAILRQAIIENAKSEMTKLPSEEELAQSITFSKQHDKKMQALFRRVRRNNILHTLHIAARRVAVAVLVLSAAVFGVLSLNPSVQATIKHALVTITLYSFTDTNKPPARDWTLGYLPEGFTLSFSDVTEPFSTFFYEDESRQIVLWTYAPAVKGTRMALDDKNYLFSQATIHGQTVDVFTATQEHDSNYVLWQQDGYIFKLAASLDVDELLEMVRFVK